MRYGSFWLISTTDESIRMKLGRKNIGIKKDYINIEFTKKIPMQKVVNVSATRTINDSQLSAGKALAGGLIGGGLGMVVGGAMGGKKIVNQVTIQYIGDDGQTKDAVLQGPFSDTLRKRAEKYLKKHV